MVLNKSDIVHDAYLQWMTDLVVGDRYPEDMYSKLLRYLNCKEFRYSISMDANREGDGIDLRYRFSLDYDQEDALCYLTGPCTVLEMMIALAIRCEETIMDDPNVGNRTGQWFWEMVKNLGLKTMIDTRFDEVYVDEIIERFLDREYEPNGEGGLFVIRNCDYDLRDVEIWYQLCWYLDSIT